MLLNTVLLPLTGLSTIKSFMQKLESEQPGEWPKFLASNLLTTYFYFLTYLVQLMFLSVGFWLLDLPHLIVKSVRRCFWNQDKPFVDTYAFDLGYHMSYGLTVFAIGTLFASTVPLVPLFCVAFFAFKYYVDKYNLSFVYNSEF